MPSYVMREKHAQVLNCTKCNSRRLCGVKDRHIRVEEKYNRDGSLMGLIKYYPKGCLKCGACLWLKKFIFVGMQEIDQTFALNPEFETTIISTEDVSMALKYDAHDRQFSTVSEYTKKSCRSPEHVSTYIRTIAGDLPFPNRYLGEYASLWSKILDDSPRKEDVA